jgi:hypothetical protein
MRYGFEKASMRRGQCVRCAVNGRRWVNACTGLCRSIMRERSGGVFRGPLHRLGDVKARTSAVENDASRRGTRQPTENLAVLAARESPCLKLSAVCD